MGTIKDIHDIIKEFIAIVLGRKLKQRYKLSKYLEAIADVMDFSRGEFEEFRVPYESKGLIDLVNHADDIANHFKEELQGIKELFDHSLPRIGELMRDSDFFIDEKPRYRLHHDFETDDPEFPKYASEKIEEACNEMKRVASKLRAYEIILGPPKEKD